MSLYIQNNYESVEVRKDDGFVNIQKGKNHYIFSKEKHFCNFAYGRYTNEELEWFVQNYPDITITFYSDEPKNLEELDEQFALEKLKVNKEFVLRVEVPLAQHSQLVIRRVENEADFRIFSAIGATIFEEKADFIFNFFKMDIQRGRPHYYVGFADEIPVAIAQMLDMPSVAGLYWVGVLPEFRHRHFGSDIVAYAVNQEIAKGQDNFVLCSSPEAERMYEKLGFVHENNLFQRQRKMGVPG